MVIKFLYQLLQRKEFLIAGRRPSEKGNKVYDCLCEEALLDQILKGGMAASLAQLFMLLICDRRTMHIHRDLPAEGIVKTIIFRRGRQILISSDNVCDPHEVIVHYVCKVICREAV